MVTHTWNLTSAFNPSESTHSSEQLGALFKGTSVVGIECGRELFTPPTTFPASTENQTHGLQVTSPL